MLYELFPYVQEVFFKIPSLSSPSAAHIVRMTMWAVILQEIISCAYPTQNLFHTQFSKYEENQFTGYTHINYFYPPLTQAGTLTQAMLLVVVVLMFARFCHRTQQYYIIANFTLPAGYTQ